MKSIRPLLFLLVLISVSNNTYSQSLKLNAEEYFITEEKNDSQFLFKKSVNTQSLISNDNSQQSSLMVQKDFDKSYSKYLGLSKADIRYNLNFTKVDPCNYSGTGNINLSLIRNGYDPYYYNSNFQPNFFEHMVCVAAKSFLSNLKL